jgi:phosphatidate phosphatase APP1
MPRRLRALLLALSAGLAVRAAPVHADTPALLLPPNVGRPDAVWVFGRVLEERHGARGPRAWRTARALAGHDLPGAEVEVVFLGRTARAVSGHDGEFEVELRPAEGERFPPGRHEAEVRVKEVTARAAVEVAAPGAPFLLVSDLDDTVAVTNVTRTRELLASTFLEDAETQPPVPGMAALYRCLTAGGSPFVIVSGTPVQLAPRVARFLEKNGFPPAALVLRNLGWKTVRGGYKEPALARLAERFPGARLVLVGDSGERDPEIFAAFMKAHPGRVLRAYVRRATATPGPAARFEGLQLFADPAEVAADAVARGLVGACR